MRPVSLKQNVLKNPLNLILGRESHVRILRVFSMDFDGPLSTSDIAKHSGLKIQHVRRSLVQLEKIGILSPAGQGSRMFYQLRDEEPLLASLIAVFKAEKNRFDSLIDEIQQVIKDQKMPPISVWVQSFPEKFGEEMVLGIRYKDAGSYLYDLQRSLSSVESTFEQPIEIELFTGLKKDIDKINIKQLIFGIPPVFKPAVRSGKTHADHDQESLERGKIIAEKILVEPKLIKKALAYIEKNMQLNPGLNKTYEEWKEILTTYSRMRLAKFLSSNTQRSIRLRQSNPFSAILAD